MEQTETKVKQKKSRKIINKNKKKNLKTANTKVRNQATTTESTRHLQLPATTIWGTRSGVKQHTKKVIRKFSILHGSKFYEIYNTINNKQSDNKNNNNNKKTITTTTKISINTSEHPGKRPAKSCLRNQ